MENVKLNFLDRQKIKRQKQSTELKRQLQNTNILDRNLNCEIIKNDMQKQTEERQLEVEKLKVDTDYYKTKIQISKLKNKNNVLNILAKNQEKSATTDEKDGYKFCSSRLNLSLISSLITATTSVFGIWCMQLGTTAKIGATMFFIVLSILSNKLLNRLPKFLDKYLDIKSKISVFNLVISVVCCSACTLMSLYTNLKFWNSFNLDMISKYILSFIFDFFAIAFTFMGYSLENLNYKKSYLDSILKDENIVLENSKEKGQKKVNIEEENTESKTTSIGGEKGIYNDLEKVNISDIKSKNDTQENNKNIVKNTTEKSKNDSKKLVHNSNRKKVKTIEDMQVIIDSLDEGAVLKPSMFDMQGDKNYYNKILKCRNVVKEDKKYIKRNDEKIVSIADLKKSN